MTNNKQQTAVEWLEKNMWEHIEYKPTFEIQRIRKKIQQAKEMEKQIIIDAIIICEKEHYAHSTVYPPQFVIDKAEQYYKQTYGGNNGKEVK
jgi:hypothetical protein